MAYTPEERATAVGRVLAGESRRKVADAMGVSDSTVRSWVKQSESRETAGAQELANRARAIADEISHLETIARHRLITRIADLAEKATDLDQVAKAYARVTDKALLAAGKPTSIVRNQDQVDHEIEKLLEEMADRERDRDRAAPR